MSKDFPSSLTARNWFRAVIFCLLTALLPARADQSITLAWNPSPAPSVAAYKIYFGPSSHCYTNSFLCPGDATNAVVGGLVEGATYFLAVTSLDGAGNESQFSDEVSYSVPTTGVSQPDPGTATNSPTDGGNPAPAGSADSGTTPDSTNSVTVTTPPNPDPATNPVVIVPASQPDGSPTIDPIADISLHDTDPVQNIIVTGITPGNSHRLVRLAISTSNRLLQAPVWRSGGSVTARTLTLKALPNAAGTCIVTITAVNNSPTNNTFRRSFTVTVQGYPKLIRRPASVVAMPGRNVTLSVAAVGKGPLAYSWQFNGETIRGASQPYLILRNINTNRAGIYTVTVANSCGSTNCLAAVTLRLPATTTAVAQVHNASPASRILDNGNLTSTAATLGTPERNAAGNFTFTVNGLAGAAYLVEGSADLKNWSVLSTNTVPFVFEDKQSANLPARFYRATYEPEF